MTHKSIRLQAQKPVIALDIDDVLVDSVTGIFDHYNQTYGTKLTKRHYYLKDLKALVTDYTIAAKRFETYLASDAYMQLAPLPEAVKVIEELRRYYRFVAVTSRPGFIRQKTINWLEQHFKGVVDDVILTHFIMTADTYETVLTKVEVCKKINALYMIEDHLHHAIPVAEVGIMVFLLDQPWNQSDTLPATIKRVTTWQEIENQLLRQGANHV